MTVYFAPLFTLVRPPISCCVRVVRPCTLQAVKMTSTKHPLPYEYYYLPFCRPDKVCIRVCELACVRAFRAQCLQLLLLLRVLKRQRLLFSLAVEMASSYRTLRCVLRLHELTRRL